MLWFHQTHTNTVKVLVISFQQGTKTPTQPQTLLPLQGSTGHIAVVAVGSPLQIGQIHKAATREKENVSTWQLYMGGTLQMESLMINLKILTAVSQLPAPWRKRWSFQGKTVSSSSISIFALHTAFSVKGWVYPAPTSIPQPLWPDPQCCSQKSKWICIEQVPPKTGQRGRKYLGATAPMSELWEMCLAAAVNSERQDVGSMAGKLGKYPEMGPLWA